MCSNCAKQKSTIYDVPSWTRKRSDPNRIGNTDVSLGKLGSIRRQVLEHKFRVQSSLLVSEEFPKQTFVRKNFMEQHHPKSESIRTLPLSLVQSGGLFSGNLKNRSAGKV